MRKKVVKINESAINNIVAESVKKVLNEISDRTVADALEVSHDYYSFMGRICYKFKDLLDNLDDLAGYGWNPVGTKNEEALSIRDEFSSLFERFKRFYTRKQNQYSSFEDEYIRRGRPDIE